MEEMPSQDESVDKLLRSRMRGAESTDRAALKRAADALLRRGYAWDEINAAVERYRAETEED